MGPLESSVNKTTFSFFFFFFEKSMINNNVNSKKVFRNDVKGTGRVQSEKCLKFTNVLSSTKSSIQATNCCVQLSVLVTRKIATSPSTSSILYDVVHSQEIKMRRSLTSYLLKRRRFFRRADI